MLPAARCAIPARAFAGIVAAGLITAACSNTTPSVNRRPHAGSGTASMVNGVQQITVVAGDTFRFAPSTIVVHPGRVRVVLVNDGTGAPHTWSLLGFPAAFAPLAVAGGSTSSTFIAPTLGSYAFECTIHSRQGETGTLMVVPR